MSPSRIEWGPEGGAAPTEPGFYFAEPRPEIDGAQPGVPLLACVLDDGVRFWTAQGIEGPAPLAADFSRAFRRWAAIPLPEEPEPQPRGGL